MFRQHHRLQHRLNFGIEVLYLDIALAQDIVLADEEERWDALHVVVGCVLRVNAVGVVDAYPRQVFRLRFPEVLIGVERHLIYLEALRVILII